MCAMHTEEVDYKTPQARDVSYSGTRCMLEFGDGV